MNTKIQRREFLTKSTKAGIACGALMFCPKFLSLSQTGDEELPDLKELCYCSYSCPPDCKMLKGTVENDTALKKEAYEEFKIKERHGVDFDPDKIFCYGCKNTEKPEGIVLKKCTIRACAISKGFECCVECDELVSCEKELWTQYPDFKKYVIELQKKYNQKV